MRKVKGFTLIECLIAMFILGISSLLLCQGYTQLMRLTNRTSTINTSIGKQMADAEGGLLADASHSTKLLSDTNFEVKLISSQNTDTPVTPVNRDFDGTTGVYPAKINVYEVKAYGADGAQYPEASSKDGVEMRYIYFSNN